MKPLFSAREPDEARTEARSYVAPETLCEIEAEIERLRIVSRILDEYDRSLIDTLVCRHYPHGQTPPDGQVQTAQSSQAAPPGPTKTRSASPDPAGHSTT